MYETDRQENTPMKIKDLESDAFVFFGATGDLAYEQIFPALQAMIIARTLRYADHWGGKVCLES